MDDLKQSNAHLQDQNTILRAQLAAGAAPMSAVEIQSQQLVSSALDERLKLLEEENREKDVELERLRKDQEDLLELLTDQEMKLMGFKNRLREMGETVDDDGDSDNLSVGSDT